MQLRTQPTLADRDLLIYQHVPVARCVELIADLTGGTGPSTGFVHGMIARCATAVRETVTLIKSLIGHRVLQRVPPGRPRPGLLP
ncbi:MAG TPA: hypothetical protein VK887_14700 [Pseudonocardiaceae bacterium]|nr:hypothetical protein [Pseudonocardiaceae bacterium]